MRTAQRRREVPEVGAEAGTQSSELVQLQSIRKSGERSSLLGHVTTPDPGPGSASRQASAETSARDHRRIAANDARRAPHSRLHCSRLRATWILEAAASGEESTHWESIAPHNRGWCYQSRYPGRRWTERWRRGGTEEKGKPRAAAAMYNFAQRRSAGCVVLMSESRGVVSLSDAVASDLRVRCRGDECLRSQAPWLTLRHGFNEWRSGLGASGIGFGR